MTRNPYGYTGSARLLERVCRTCGCTEHNACIDAEHGACWWVEWDLCSHCDRDAKAVRTGSDLLLLGLLVVIVLVAAHAVRSLF